MELGNRIAALRKEKNMTQEQLAIHLNVSNQAVSKWEAGQCCPDVMLLPLLADIFGVTLDYLFGREKQVKEKAENELPWEDDGTLRAVLYVGHELIGENDIDGREKASRITFEYEGEALNISSMFSVSCGDVEGNVAAGAGVDCGNIGGNAAAGASISCGDVEGSVAAGAGVDCGDIDGSVSAGACVSCGDIDGTVVAGASISCGDIAGTVECGTDLSCGDIDGNVRCGGNCSCGDIGGSVYCGEGSSYGEVDGEVCRRDE